MHNEDTTRIYHWIEHVLHTYITHTDMSDSNLLSQQVPGYVDEGASQALHSRASTDEKALYILDRVEIPDVVSACEYN